MRLDVFLKQSRLIKRRTIAKAMCDEGRVTVNGQQAKAGDTVHVGDMIGIRFGDRTMAVRVLKVEQVIGKQGADALYERLDEPLKDSP
ncbi:MAG: RNA-binding S4 domain-containing protein [Candidatus Carbobacillus sp.]|nr:RNA-binding S4 domain-containing protein [Candidatus Carbobacillus sp.]